MHHAFTCPQRNDIVRKQCYGDCTAYDFLDVSTNDCNFHAEPHQVAWQLWVFLPTMLRQIESSHNAQPRGQALEGKALQQPYTTCCAQGSLTTVTVHQEGALCV